MAFRIALFGAGVLSLIAGGCSGSSKSDGDGGGATGGSAASGAAGSGHAGAGSGGKGSGGSSTAGSQNGGSAGSGTAGSGGTTAGGTGGSSGSSGAASGASGEGSGSGGEGGDAGESGGGTAGGGEGGAPDDRWQGCPTADDYAGDDSWPNTVEVTEAATYCATFNETRTLKEELEKKALLRIAPGTYHLPPGPREDLGLPVCIAYGPDGTGFAPSPVSVAYTATPFSGDVDHQYRFEAAADGPDRNFSMTLFRTLASGEDFSFALDGRENAADTLGSQGFSFYLCDSTEGSCYVDRLFDSCTHAGSRLFRHEISLDDGELVLDLRLGFSQISTEPGAFVRAAGTFRGQSFEQADYFRLIYNPEHHHFVRDFAVLFDAPIDGACGVEISDFVYDEASAPNAYAVDCALDRLETLTVVDFSVTQDP